MFLTEKIVRNTKTMSQGHNNQLASICCITMFSLLCIIKIILYKTQLKCSSLPDCQLVHYLDPPLVSHLHVPSCLSHIDNDQFCASVLKACFQLPMAYMLQYYELFPHWDQSPTFAWTLSCKWNWLQLYLLNFGGAEFYY